LKPDYFDLNSVTNVEGTARLFEEQSSDGSEYQSIVDSEVISSNLEEERQSIDSDEGTISLKTSAEAAEEPITPPTQVLVSEPSNSDSTVHEGSHLSAATTTTTRSETTDHTELLEKEEYETVVLEEADTIAVDDIAAPTAAPEEETFAPITTLSSRAIRKTSSIASSMSGFSSMHPMEKRISSGNSSVIDFMQQIPEKSTSTSSFQRTLLGRKKSTKKLLQKVEPSLSPTAEETSTNSNRKSTFASMLNSGKKVAPAVAELNRSKSSSSKRKWSISTNPGKRLSSQSFLDPVTFLAEPSTAASISEKDDDKQHFISSDTLASLALINKLHESMIHGGCITSNLHIPMDLW
jgi:hypothetical protein